MKTRLLLLCFSVAASLGCSKSSSERNDREAPVITVTGPVDDQVYAGAQTIRITGSATDNAYLKEIHVEISDLSTAEEYLHVHIHPAAASYRFDQPYDVKASTQYRIRVIADDASSNSSVVIREICVN